jgi:hypothetical protein
VLYFMLLAYRLRLGWAEDRVARLRQRVLSRI